MEKQEDGESLKKCPKCQTDISKKAKKCPNCHSDLRIWFMRHKIITGVLILIVIGYIAGSGSKNSSNDTSNNAPLSEISKNTNENTSSGDKTYKIKEPVEVGYFGYIVNEVKEYEKIGEEKATGIFKVVIVGAFNKDKEMRYLDNSMFKITDNKGRFFSYSPEGETALSERMEGEGNLFLKQINPSLQTAGAIVFDIPKDAEGLKLEVSGGFGSPEKKYIDLQ